VSLRSMRPVLLAVIFGLSAFQSGTLEDSRH
jgi:hypothetical protein